MPQVSRTARLIGAWLATWAKLEKSDNAARLLTNGRARGAR